MKNSAKINLAIFASGSGSNARKIIDYFKENDLIKVSLILSNRSKAGVLQHAEDTRTPAKTINNASISDAKAMLSLLDLHSVDYIILAGFLRKIPPYLISSYKEKILNIHPSLLPKYGGKGMYGIRVHQAVKNSGDKQSGMTIHLVNEQFDKGKIIFQDKCLISPEDNAEQIAAKVLALEHTHYAHIIEAYILDRLTS